MIIGFFFWFFTYSENYSSLPFPLFDLEDSDLEDSVLDSSIARRIAFSSSSESYI
jgi:hypothetical protein